MIDQLAALLGDDHWKWLSLALILAIAELLVPGVFLIWVAAAAAIVGAVAFLTDINMAAQLLLFALAAITMTYGARRWYTANPVASEDPLLNDRAARLIGQTALVVEPVSAHAGRAKIGDSVWPARGADLAVGTHARIKAVSNGVVQLEAIATPLPLGPPD